MTDRTRYSISLSADEADVLDVLAHLNGYSGRSGAWVGDQVRSLVAHRRHDADVEQLLAARREYREQQERRGRRTRHGLGVIDGGAA